MENMEALLTGIGQGGVAFAVMVLIIRYFLNKEKIKDASLEKLQSELRATEKENLMALHKLATMMDKFVDGDKLNQAALLKEIQEMRKSIEDKLTVYKK